MAEVERSEVTQAIMLRYFETSTDMNVVLVTSLEKAQEVFQMVSGRKATSLSICFPFSAQKKRVLRKTEISEKPLKKRNLEFSHFPSKNSPR